ncbi:unnamed protein product [Microthlaspi erraticum]|uniref:Zinc finger PHD-type domain-containing protein n=1 Tax=Microthlaspi erraticum TaxID=1685480 RepID=A0A6D2KPL2_9BRAS|nr:unnamed protein product [Microthlaspi erraticum]
MEEIEQIHEGFLGAIKLSAHPHLLFPTNTSSKCIVCSQERLENTRGFSCVQCELYFHKDCIEITIPSHHRHPLKLHDPYYKAYKCFLCRKWLWDMFYYCSRCVFVVCMSCLKKRLVIDDRPRAHEHPLSLMPINSISFTCEACGDGNAGSYPCVCLQCWFIVHESCLDLPRVIRINRHDHRISHVDILTPEEWICGVCHMSINNKYGAYSCLICPYSVHSKCAIKDDVWDGRELEGRHDEDTEDKTEDVAPFIEVTDDKAIKHFSHEHTLNLFYQDVLLRDENQRCNACTLPVYIYGTCYMCMHCDFILHETCANLPRTKRHELHNSLFTLCPNPKPGEELEFGKSFFRCDACKTLTNGFRYESGNMKLDVRCAMISGEFRHESHSHSLFILTSFPTICSVCSKLASSVLSCVECSFNFLCFKCATLPNEVFYKHDKHPLYLRYHRHVYCHYWCEICEKPTNPYMWFYSCETCASTVHIECVLGKSPYMKPGHSFLLYGLEYQVVSNNHVSRQFCIVCHLRCENAFVIKNKNETSTSCICSLECLYSLVGFDRIEMLPTT